jgi:glycosyltransferase involved in cell wall biosynthesis
VAVSASLDRLAKARAEGRRDLRPLRVMVVGLRGVVDVQGGIETHARKLYPLLARLGCEVEIVQRSPYFPAARRRREWHGMRLTYLWSPTRPGLETAVHTLLGVLYAALKRPDVLHLHAVGPGFLAPLARLLGLCVVLTHHAHDYEREKWGGLAKALLRTGERLGVSFANRPIAVSPVIEKDIGDRYGVDAALIPNGAPKVLRAVTHGSLDKLGLEPGRYVLCVARLEPTKRQFDLIDAFAAAQLRGWKLVLVGQVLEGDAYCARLVERAARDRDVILAGYQTGIVLRELYSHAGLFVLPSALEGHPIALLEAASYGVPILASANTANLTVPLRRERFFAVGDTVGLAALLRDTVAAARPDAECAELRAMVRTLYSWRRAARLTRSVYEAAAGWSEARQEVREGA